MKQLQLFIIMALFSANTAHAIKNGQDVAKLHLKPKGVAAISALDQNGEQQSLCSGVFISDHLLLTAKHCVLDGLPLLTILDTKALDTFVLAPASQIRASSALDLALIAYPANTAKNFSKLASNSPKIQEPMETRGFGGSEDPETSFAPLPLPGHATELEARYSLFGLPADYLEFRLHPTGAFSISGDSGSPLFNKNGELAGIMTTYERLDATDQYGNEWVQNTAVSMVSDAAKSFIQKASADLLDPK